MSFKVGQGQCLEDMKGHLLSNYLPGLFMKSQREGDSAPSVMSPVDGGRVEYMDRSAYCVAAGRKRWTYMPKSSLENMAISNYHLPFDSDTVKADIEIPYFTWPR